MRNSELLYVQPKADLADYLAQLMPDLKAECAGSHCSKVLPIAQMVVKDGKRYCSSECDRFHNAPMIKPQPKPTIVDGWAI